MHYHYWNMRKLVSNCPTNMTATSINILRGKFNVHCCFQVVFSSNQTYELMHCLEEFRTFYNSKEHNTAGECKDKKGKGGHEKIMHYEVGYLLRYIIACES